MNVNNVGYKKIVATWWYLKLFYGLYFIIAGVDKFFNIFVDWPKYVHPYLITNLAMPVYTLVVIFGIVQIFAGGLILTFWTRLGSFLASLGFFASAINLLCFGTFISNNVEYFLVVGPYFGIGLNYIVMTAGALTLYRLDSIVRICDEREPAT